MPTDPFQDTDKLKDLKKKIDEYSKKQERMGKTEIIGPLVEDKALSEPISPDNSKPQNPLEKEKKGIYETLEGKWYDFLDKVNEIVPVYSIIDPIDKIVPSFVVFLVSIFLIVILAGAGTFLLFTGGFPGFPEFGSPEYSFIVLDEEGSPISGVAVTLSSAENTFEAISDDVGEFRVALPNSIVTVSASKTGYQSYNRELSASKEITNEIVLDKIEAALQNKTIKVYANGSLYSGTLTAFFTCSNNASTNTQTFTGGILQNISVPDGCGQMSVKVSGAAGYDDATVALISSGITTINLVAKEIPKGSAKVTVIDKATRGAIIDVPVYLYKDSGIISDQGLTSASGVKIFSDVLPGTYYFSVSGLSNYLDGISASFDVSEENLSEMMLELDKVAAGTSKEKLLIKFVDESGDGLQGVSVVVVSGSHVFSSSAGSNSDGIYTRANMDANTYTIIARKAQYVAKIAQVETVQASSSTPTEITLESAETDNSGSVIVKVLDGTVGIEDATVFLYDEAHPNFAVASDTTNSSGEAVFAWMPPAQYYAKAQLEEAGGESEHKSLEAGQSITITIELEADTANLRAKVLDSRDNSVIEGAKVSMINSADDHVIYANGIDTNSQGYTPFTSIPANAKPYIRVEADDYLPQETLPIAMSANANKTVTISLKPSAGIQDPGDFNLNYLGIFNDAESTNPATTINANSVYYANFKLLVPAVYEGVKTYFAAGEFGAVDASKIKINEITLSRPSFNVTYYGCFNEFYATNCGSPLSGSGIAAKQAVIRQNTLSAGEYAVKVKFTIANTAVQGENVKLQFGLERDNDGTIVHKPVSAYNSVGWVVGQVNPCTGPTCAEPIGDINATLVHGSDDPEFRDVNLLNTNDTFSLYLGVSPPTLEVEIKDLNALKDYSGYRVLVESKDNTGAVKIIKIGDDANVDAEIRTAAGTPANGKFLFAGSGGNGSITLIPQEQLTEGLIRIAWLDKDGNVLVKKDIKIRINTAPGSEKDFEVDVSPSTVIEGINNQFVEVTVKNAANHQPVEYAIVKLTNRKNDSGAPDFTGIPAEWNLFTNAQGVAYLSNIDAVEGQIYYILVSKPDSDYSDFSYTLNVRKLEVQFAFRSFDCIELSPAILDMDLTSALQRNFTIDAKNQPGCTEPILVKAEIGQASPGLLTSAPANASFTMNPGDSQTITVKANSSTLPGEYGVTVFAKYASDGTAVPWSIAKEIPVRVKPKDDYCFDIFRKNSTTVNKYSFDINNQTDSATIINSCYPESIEDRSLLKNVFMPYARLDTCDDQTACIQEKGLLGEYGTVKFDWRLAAYEYPVGYNNDEDNPISGSINSAYSSLWYSEGNPNTSDYGGKLESISPTRQKQSIVGLQDLANEFNDPAANLVMNAKGDQERYVVPFVEIKEGSLISEPNAPKVLAKVNDSYEVEAYVDHSNDTESDGTFDITAYNINLGSTKYTKLSLEDYKQPESGSEFREFSFTLKLTARGAPQCSNGCTYQMRSTRTITGDGGYKTISNSSVDDFPMDDAIKTASSSFEITILQDSINPATYENASGQNVESIILLSAIGNESSPGFETITIPNTGGLGNDIFGKLTDPAMEVLQNKIDIAVLIDTSQTMDPQWQSFCSEDGLKNRIPEVFTELGYDVNLYIYAMAKQRSETGQQCQNAVAEWGEDAVGFPEQRARGDEDIEAWAATGLSVLENHVWRPNARRAIFIIGDNDPTGACGGEMCYRWPTWYGTPSDFRIGDGNEQQVVGKFIDVAKAKSVGVNFLYKEPTEYQIKTNYGSATKNDLIELMEHAKNETKGDVISTIDITLSLPEVAEQISNAIARITIPSTGKKQFHVKLNVKPTYSCTTTTGLPGVTGNSSLYSTRRLLNWDWRNGTDGTYFCDSVKSNGEPNEGVYVCDGTQFTQEVLNRILAIKSENKIPGDPRYIELTNFTSWLVVDSYNADFLADFNSYAKSLQGGFGEGVAPSNLFPNASNTFDLNQYVSKGRIEFSVKCPTYTLKNGILSCPAGTDTNTLPTSGLYLVKIDIAFAPGKSGQFIDPQTGQALAKIKVNLELLSELASDNLLYYLPFDGPVGLVKTGSGANDYNFSRNNYGVDFKGDVINLFSIPKITTNLFYTYPSMANKSPDKVLFSVDVKKLKNFEQMNGINEIGRKGQLFSIERTSQSGTRNFKISFAPSQATPILMRAAKNANNVAGAFYTIKNGNNQYVTSSQTNNNWSWWGGAASYSSDCVGLDGLRLAANRADRVYGANDSSACSLNAPQANSFGFAGNTTQLSQASDEVYYLSVFYTPNSTTAAEQYYLQTACNDSTAGFRSLSNAGDYAGRISLNELPNAAQEVGGSDKITYVDDLFRSLNSNEDFMCLGINNNRFEITWNEEKLFKAIASLQDFEGNGLTSCYYSTQRQ